LREIALHQVPNTCCAIAKKNELCGQICPSLYAGRPHQLLKLLGFGNVTIVADALTRRLL
jgi:hypothetical protein